MSENIGESTPLKKENNTISISAEHIQQQLEDALINTEVKSINRNTENDPKGQDAPLEEEKDDNNDTLEKIDILKDRSFLSKNKELTDQMHPKPDSLRLVENSSLGYALDNVSDSLQSIPAFYPTKEQFQDPITFYESIEKFATKYGAIKVVPPQEWNPGFHLNLDCLKFRSVKQNLKHNSSEYNDKILFYKNLLQFHKMNKTPLQRLPSIDKRVLDLYKLRKSVQSKGGFDLVCTKKLWALIGRELGYTGRIMTSLSSSLKSAYQRVLYKFDLYESGITVDSSDEVNEFNKRPLEDSTISASECNKQGRDENSQTRAEYQMIKSPLQDMGFTTMVSNSRHPFKRPRDVLKAKGFRTNFESFTEEKLGISQNDDYTYPNYDYNYWHEGASVMDYPFPSAESSDSYSIDEFYDIHKKFESKWYENNTQKVCIQHEINEFYTFAQSEKLQEFKILSGVSLPTKVHGSGFCKLDGKSNKVDKNVFDPWNLNNVPLNEHGIFRYFREEHEELTSPSLDISMLFTTKSWGVEDHFLPNIDYHHIGDPKYKIFISPKDFDKFEQLLKKLLLEAKDQTKKQVSTLFPGAIGDDILENILSGDSNHSRAPATNSSFDKLYDHTPGSNSIRLNNDLFISPQFLKDSNIEFFYTLHKPGEFIFKSQKCYSSSVSLGFSITENVNFATKSWLDVAIEAEKWFANQLILPNFSSFEILTNLLEDCKDPGLLKQIKPIFHSLLEEELETRSLIKSKLPHLKQVNNKFDYITDDILINSFPSKIVLVSGYDTFNLEPKNFLQKVSNQEIELNKEFKIEFHTYHSDEKLKSFERMLNSSSQSSSEWLVKFDEALNGDCKPPFRVLKNLLIESEKMVNKVPEAQILKDYLENANVLIERCQEVLNAKQKIRTRNKRPITSALNGTSQPDNDINNNEERELYSVDFIDNLIKEVTNLNFTCPETDQLIEFANEIYIYENTVRNFLNSDNKHSIEDFNDMIDLGKSFGVDLKSVKFLDRIVKRLTWIEESNEIFEKDHLGLNEYNKLLEDGYRYSSLKDVEIMNRLLDKVVKGKYLTEKIQHYSNLTTFSISDINQLIEECENLPVEQEVYNKIKNIKEHHLKSKNICLDIYKKIAENSEDLKIIRELQILKKNNDTNFDKELYNKIIVNYTGDENDKRPTYSFAKDSLDKSRELLPTCPVEPLDNYIRQAEDWLRRTKKLFGKTNAPFTVMKSHLENILRADQLCFDSEDVFIENLKEEQNHKIYCFCRRMEFGVMIECDKCNEWYHCRCLKYGKAQSKTIQNFICPICDYRSTIPKEYDSAKIEDLEKLINEGSSLELLPEELCLVREIYSDAVKFKARLHEELQWDGNDFKSDNIAKIKFFLRKLSGANVMLMEEYNKLRQLVYKFEPICDTPPPVVESTGKTKMGKKKSNAMLLATSGTSGSATPQQFNSETSTPSVGTPIKTPVAFINEYRANSLTDSEATTPPPADQLVSIQTTIAAVMNAGQIPITPELTDNFTEKKDNES